MKSTRQLTLHDQYLIAKMRFLAWVAKYDLNTAHRIGLVGIAAIETTDKHGRKMPLRLAKGIQAVHDGVHPAQRNRRAAG